MPKSETRRSRYPQPGVRQAREAQAAGKSREQFIAENVAKHAREYGTALLMNSPAVQRRILEKAADVVFGPGEPGA